MRLHHTTLRCNRGSIIRTGLKTSKSQGKLKAIWLHAEEKMSWAFLHTVKRHGGDVRDVVSFAVDVPDDMVKKSAVPGLFYVTEDIAPELLGFVTRFEVVAASPLEMKSCQ